MSFMRLYLALSALTNFVSLFKHLLFFAVYITTSSYILYILLYGVGNFFTDGVFYRPESTLYYGYKYVVWWLDHKEVAGFKYTFYILFSISIPYLAFVIIKSTIKGTFKELMRKIFSIKRKKEKISKFATMSKEKIKEKMKKNPKTPRRMSNIKDINEKMKKLNEKKKKITEDIEQDL